MPVILYVRVSTPHLQPHPHPQPTRTHRRGYHPPDYRRLLPWSPSAEHGACTPASGSLTGGYGRGGWRGCCRVRAPRPSSTDPCQGTCHGGGAWAAEGGGLPRQRAREAQGLTPHPPPAHPLSGSCQPGAHRLAADGVPRHSRHFRPLTKALTRRCPHRLAAKRPPEDPRVNPVDRRQDARREPHEHRLPDPDWRVVGMRGVPLDRPTPDRWYPGTPRGEFVAVVVMPALLACRAVPPWQWLEGIAPPQTRWRWLPDARGDTSLGTPLLPRPGRMATSARARPSSADRCRGPALTLAPRVQQEECR
jgi:hypothetical protein